MAFDEKISLGGGSYLRVASDSPLDSVGPCRGRVYGGLLQECDVAEKVKAGWMRRALVKIKEALKMAREIKTTRTVEIRCGLQNYSHIQLMSVKSCSHAEAGEESERARGLAEWVELGLDVRRGLNSVLISLGRPVSDDRLFVEAVRARVADKLAQQKAERELEAKNKEAKSEAAKNA